MDQAPQIRPSWWQCLWGLLPLMIGGGLFVYTLFQGITHATDSLTQIVVPGRAELNLKGNRTYTIFLEGQSVVNGKVYSTTQSVDGLACTVTAAQSGSAISVTKPSVNTSYEVSGRTGHSVLEFPTPQDGRYTFACDYGENTAGPTVVVAVGSGVGTAITRTILMSMVSLLGGVAACVIVVLIVWAMRERNRKTLSALAAILFLLTIASPLAMAQTPAEPSSTPDYDVVSIHIDHRGPGSTGTDVRNGAYTAGNVTIKDLLEQAYDVREDLISGVPGALDSVRFDVRAKIVDPDLAAVRKLTDPQRRAMLMPLLAGRFHLKAHLASREMPVYDLTLQKDGPKFSRSPDQSSHDESTSVYNTAFKVRNMPMAIFAKTLSHQLHRTVIDKTGLTGIYDFDLKWTDDNVTNPDPSAPPDIFTALEEQLGLKLQPAKGPVPTLVVDHIEMPTEN